jgi:HK97 family phage major capsid protein
VSDTALVAKIASWIPATMEILQDAPTLQGYINARLTYMVKFREQQQILAGDGTGGDLKGIDSFSGIQTAGTTNNDAFVDFSSAIGKVENVDGQANGIVMNPTDYWTIVATRRSTWFDGTGATGNTGAPFAGPPNTIWGLPTVRTRTVPTLTAYVADWSGAMIFDRMEVTVRQSDSHDTFFIYNKVAILCEERIGLAVFRPDFFVKTTIDITA